MEEAVLASEPTKWSEENTPMDRQTDAKADVVATLFTKVLAVFGNYSLWFKCHIGDGAISAVSGTIHCLDFSRYRSVCSSCPEVCVFLLSN